jgi:ATP phosphoribosyltransferase regulatory subunit
MVYQSPTGARDLLPLDVAQKRWIEERLQPVFHRWGYHRIMTSTLERLDTLMAGGAIERSTVVQLKNADDEDLGLRPELTASIARAAVTRMGGTTFPKRLCYNTNVFRRSSDSNHSRQQEFYQAGVELLGVGGVMADAETLLLLNDCLTGLGLTQWSLVLGEAGLTRSLLEPFPEPLRSTVRQSIAHLDRVALETLPMTPALRDRAALLLDLRGQPSEVLDKVAQLDLDATQQASVTTLRSLVDLLQTTAASRPEPAPAIILDLSLIRTFDYYTGLIFEAIATTDQGQYTLGQGGRYDQLLGLYHPQGQSYPGIGFSMAIEQLYQALVPTGQLPQRPPTHDWIVVPASPAMYTAAIAHAQTLRQSDLRVEMDLGSRTPSEIYDYARHRRIANIAWVKAGGEIVAESVETSSFSMI